MVGRSHCDKSMTALKGSGKHNGVGSVFRSGVIIIINPVNLQFSLVSFLPLISAVTFAIYAVLTRKVALTDNTETSFFWVSLVSAIAITIPSPLFYNPIQFSDVYFLILFSKDVLRLS